MDIRAYYDTISLTYDELYAHEQFRKYMAAHHLIAEARGRVIDIGCGTLLLEEYLLQTGLIGNLDYIIAVDSSLKMIERGIVRINKRNFPLEKLDIIVADASRMPFRKNVFQHSFAFSLLNNTLWDSVWPEVERVTQKTIIFTFIADVENEHIPRECSHPYARMAKEVLCIQLIQQEKR
jgi:ubiquinone/menaquinone biosynthesis C-methylase UbiE